MFCYRIGDHRDLQADTLFPYTTLFRSDGVRIAFGTAGSGPWILRAPSLPFSYAEREWSQGSEFFDQLAANWSVAQYDRSAEHTSELQSLMRISYAVFCLKTKKKKRNKQLHMRHRQSLINNQDTDV